MLGLNIGNSASFNTFWRKLLSFIRPCALAKLRLGLHLHEHKLSHWFQDTLNPLCECGKDIELTMHFSLHCTNFLILRQTLFQKIRNVDDSILSQSATQLTYTLLSDNQNYHYSINRLIIISTIEDLTSTERFKCSLFD